MEQKNSGCVKALAYIGAMTVILVVVLVVSFAWRYNSSAAPSNQVTLRAAPGNTSVQMFDKLAGDAGIVTFPDGWGCTRLGGRITYDDGYGPMHFYKLDCGNKTGYVNAQWVR